MTPVKPGDYVLATKYSDGDPKDHWAVGFYDCELPSGHPLLSARHMVINGDGKQMRGNGFRRVAKISAERGAWLLAHASEIEHSGKSMWGWKRAQMAASLTSKND